MNREKAQRRFIFICLAPAVILATIFIFIPTINVFRMSLYRMGGITNKKSFVGFSNFVKLMDDKNFLEAMQNSILIIVMVMICTIVLAVLFAALLSRGNFRGNEFLQNYFLHTKHFEYCCYCRYFRCNLQSEYRTAQYIFGCDSSEWIKAFSGWEIRVLLFIL